MSDHAVIKLTNGELLMATIISDNSSTVIVRDPISIRVIHSSAEEGLVERTVTSPFCPLTDDREFTLDHKHILFIKQLTDKISIYYKQLITSTEDSSTNESTNESNLEEDLDFEPTLVIPDKQLIH